MFDWLGWRVDDGEGSRVGSLAMVYEHPRTGAATWFLVRLGRFSSRYAVVPPADALVTRNRIWLPYLRETIERAPLLFAPPESIGPALEDRLRAHYRLTADPPLEVRVSAGRTPA
jgi:hypothetical protein